MENSCLTWLQLIEFIHAVGLYFVCQAYEDLIKDFILVKLKNMINNNGTMILAKEDILQFM